MFGEWMWMIMIYRYIYILCTYMYYRWHNLQWFCAYIDICIIYICMGHSSLHQLQMGFSANRAFEKGIWWFSEHDPDDPSIVYLPTFGQFLGQMLIHIPSKWSIWVKSSNRFQRTFWRAVLLMGNLSPFGDVDLSELETSPWWWTLWMIYQKQHVIVHSYDKLPEVKIYNPQPEFIGTKCLGAIRWREIDGKNSPGIKIKRATW